MAAKVPWKGVFIAEYSGPIVVFPLALLLLRWLLLRRQLFLRQILDDDDSIVPRMNTAA